MLEVLKQALEALESMKETLAEHDEPTTFNEDEAITSLRQAIAELQSQEPVCPECKAEVLYECVACSRNNYPPQRTAQEPVAHLWECLGRWSAYLVDNGERADCSPPSWLVDAVKNATIPPAQPAKPIPCANHCEATAFEIVIKNLQGEIERLKASRREWVGLTKEDKDLIEDLCKMMIGDAVFSTIDAILKGKNT